MYRYHSPVELKSYDTFKLAVALVAALSAAGLYINRGGWGMQMSSARPAVNTGTGEFAARMDVQAFLTNDDLGQATFSGKSKSGMVHLLVDDALSATVPTKNGEYTLTVPLLDVLNHKTAIEEDGYVPDGPTWRRREFQYGFADLQKQFGPNKLSAQFSITQDATDDARFWVDMRGLCSNGGKVRIIADGQPLDITDSTLGHWVYRGPFEAVAGKIVAAQAWSASDQPVGEAITVIQPPSQEVMKKYVFDLDLPANQATAPNGLTVFQGNAAPGTSLLIYVDKWVVGKSIADTNGNWVCRARIKSPGSGRIVKAVTVPFNGVPATPSNSNSVTFVNQQ